MATKKDDRRLELVSQLEETAKYMELLGENDFKVRAYRKGAQAVAASDAALEDLAAGRAKIAGVGEGLKGAIGEFLSGGAVALRDELAKKVPAGVLEMVKIPGLGPKKAMVIQKELGVSSIGELEYACRENRLVSLKGFGQTIQMKVLENIESMKANEGKFRIDEALARAGELELKLRRYLGKTAKIARVGALGRRHEIVECFEFCFTGSSRELSGAIAGLDWSGGLEDRREAVFETDLAAFSGRLKSGEPIILWVSERWPNDDVMKWLCADESVRAEMLVNVDRFVGWEPTWLEAEWLDLDRVPRESTYRVARDGGVKGVFHCHTDFSDGDATLDEMVRAAEKRGYEYIGISDHSQSAFYARGLALDRILEQRRMIAALQKKVSIRIFHGIESDILADGALDYDDEVLNGFDFIVGSIHGRFKMDDREMTARLVRALQNRYVTFWGHPTGRLVLGRKGYSLDWDECLAAAAQNGVAVEINANPHRLDADWRLGPALERAGVRVCVNPDAHSVEGLDDTTYGEYVAEKAMLDEKSILNRMPVAAMEKYLWERKKRALKPSRA